MKKTFVDLVKDYSAWKLQEKGNGKLTRNELSKLRESYKSMTGDNREAKLKKLVEEYGAWKKANKGTAKITREEFAQLKEQVLNGKQESKQSWEAYLSNYKKFKEQQEGKANKISYRELKMLKENWNEAQRKGIHLKEADPMAGGDPNAGGAGAGFDPAAGAAAPDPAMADPAAAGGETADLAQAITDAMAPFLAAAPGAGVGADMGTMDPAATPPVAGTDPNMGTGTPMMEQMILEYRKWKKANKGTSKLTEAEMKAIKEEAAKATPKKSRYETIKSRIAERQAEIEGLQENSMGPKPTAELANSKLFKHNKGNSQGTAGSNDAFGLGEAPSSNSLSKGYTSGAAAGETRAGRTWPTKATGKEAGGALQGAGATQTKVKESKADNSVKTVTDVYVDRALEPKLNFDKLKESMKKGLLG